MSLSTELLNALQSFAVYFVELSVLFLGINMLVSYLNARFSQAYPKALARKIRLKLSQSDAAGCDNALLLVQHHSVFCRAAPQQNHAGCELFLSHHLAACQSHYCYNVSRFIWNQLNFSIYIYFLLLLPFCCFLWESSI